MKDKLPLPLSERQKPRKPAGLGTSDSLDPDKMILDPVLKHTTKNNEVSIWQEWGSNPRHHLVMR